MAIRVIRKVGVETGGSNIQFGVNPENGDIRIIEMNPRVSRSSALASKATGFPIAKIAAKLAVGYTLDEIPNDITRKTPASFEPTIDYVVAKIPKWDFEKFREAEDVLGTQMKSVGEVMAIGRTFKEALFKGLRSLEAVKPLRLEDISDDELQRKLARPNSQRFSYITYALQHGWPISEIHRLSKIDPWFLDQLKEVMEIQHDIEGSNARRNLGGRVARVQGSRAVGSPARVSDRAFGRRGARVSQASWESSRFTNASTPAARSLNRTRRISTRLTKRKTNRRRPNRRKIMILGSGPNRIGQGIEFDYCCCHASFALHEAGFETIMVNCNPETVSTDYDTSDRLYFEPLTFEDVMNIVDVEKPEGVIVQFGGQTPLNLAKRLHHAGVKIIGTSPDSIDLAEDRKRFGALLEELGIPQPDNGMAASVEEAREVAARIGYPVLVRPSYVLGGRAMAIVYDQEQLDKYVHNGRGLHAGSPGVDRQVSRTGGGV